MGADKGMLCDGFGGTNIKLEGYDGFFTGLLDLVRGRIIDSVLGEAVQAYARDYVDRNTFNEEHRDPSGYQRSYLGRDPESGWEAILMVWSEGNRTTIHGHPQFAGYTFAGGDFRLEVFQKEDSDNISLAQMVEINSRSGFHSIGELGRFDNHLHRITCLSDRGYSLHIYSDDALKGRKYEDPALQ